MGNFKNNGREWRHQGTPELVNVHDFIDPEQTRRAIRVYDISNNVGWVSVCTDHDTATFAVNASRRWWRTMGKKRHPAAKHLMITADGGGSNVTIRCRPRGRLRDRRGRTRAPGARFHQREVQVLLMDVFPRSDSRSGPRISPKAADIVRGNIAEQQDDAPITGQWNLHAWTVLRAIGRLSRDHDRSSSSHWIWNEGVPADIPTFDGHRVVVLGSPSYPRSFVAQRDFRGLRADIDVERLLSPDEVAAWVGRLSRSGPGGKSDR